MLSTTLVSTVKHSLARPEPCPRINPTAWPTGLAAVPSNPPASACTIACDTGVTGAAVVAAPTAVKLEGDAEGVVDVAVTSRVGDAPGVP